MNDANQHLLTYAVWDPQEKVFFYPFVQRTRWVHWAHDTAERHHFNGQKSVFMKKHVEYANITEEDLRKIIQEGGAALE